MWGRSPSSVTGAVHAVWGCRGRCQRCLANAAAAVCCVLRSWRAEQPTYYHKFNEQVAIRSSALCCFVCSYARRLSVGGRREQLMSRLTRRIVAAVATLPASPAPRPSLLLFLYCICPDTSRYCACRAAVAAVRSAAVCRCFE